MSVHKTLLVIGWEINASRQNWNTIVISNFSQECNATLHHILFLFVALDTRFLCVNIGILHALITTYTILRQVHCIAIWVKMHLPHSQNPFPIKSTIVISLLHGGNSNKTHI